MPPGLHAVDPALIVNGVPWFDDRGRTVNAHGACIIADGERYYLFGEYKTDDENRFIGFSCYSSPDLASWTFERLVLPPQPGGLLGPGRIGERVKVMRCPSTGRFVMLMHTDDLGYTDPQIGLASSDTVNGEYTFHGALTHAGDPVRGWDMGTFIDRDGNGYLLLHEGHVYRLSEDYTVAEQKVVSGVAPGGESPAMLRGRPRRLRARWRSATTPALSWPHSSSISTPAPRSPGCATSVRNCRAGSTPCASR
ncbi:family 43 glycosylhydrolase [Occultella kanbiaonis]|uniref:family 43 glycosylhydrolase n=1 Tax=Occultella kanbiaonis TaxID=2675754 RepID=UPI001A9997D0|nr:family 43 glycosylhydrolase [Occultella kanbiaonis]